MFTSVAMVAATAISEKTAARAAALQPQSAPEDAARPGPPPTVPAPPSRATAPRRSSARRPRR